MRLIGQLRIATAALFVSEESSRIGRRANATESKARLAGFSAAATPQQRRSKAYPHRFQVGTIKTHHPRRNPTMSMQKKRRFNISITEREHATILAALRLWQEADEYNRGDLRDIAEAAGVPLSSEEIDVLCERINFTSNREVH